MAKQYKNKHYRRMLGQRRLVKLIKMKKYSCSAYICNSTYDIKAGYRKEARKPFIFKYYKSTHKNSLYRSLKKTANKKVRNNKNILNHGQYKKIYPIQWLFH